MAKESITFFADERLAEVLGRVGFITDRTKSDVIRKALLHGILNALTFPDVNEDSLLSDILNKIVRDKDGGKN